MTPAQHAGTSLNQSLNLHAKHLDRSVKTSVKGNVQQILATNQCLSLICKYDKDNTIKKLHMLVRYVLKHGSWFEVVVCWS